MIVWFLFILAVFFMIAIDLGVFNKEAYEISVKEASVWTAVWVSLALMFSLVVHYVFLHDLVDNPTGMTPSEAVVNYLTGYLIELSLSVDNIFVIAVIFSTFRIPMKYQHRVLIWGIVGALIFRASMILFGVALINQFSWMIYIFGLFLLYTAYTMYTSDEEEVFDPKKSFIFRNIRKFIPISNELNGDRFFIRKRHIVAATPLFVALIVIEVMDVIFALDSVPAILAITNDPFIVFSSNILAILGLRSLYFFLSNMLNKFSYLEYSLIAILSFVGAKMLLSHIYHIPQWFSLLFILLALILGVVGSLLKLKEV